MASSINFLADSIDAQARPVADKLADFVNAQDFGVVADAVFDTDSRVLSGGTDNQTAFQNCIDAAAGREIVLPAGAIRIGGSLTYYTDGYAGGLCIRGQGRETSIIVADFDTDPLFDVNGSATPYRFQRGGGLSQLSVYAPTGKSPGAMISAKGWSWARLADLACVGTEHFVHCPEDGGFANPDAYPSVDWLLQQVYVRGCSGTAILSDSGPGQAGWVLDQVYIIGCGGDAVRGRLSGWTIRNGSFSFNGGRGLLSLDEGSHGRAKHLRIDMAEFDGNIDGGIYLSGVASAQVSRCLFISRILGGEPASTTHVAVDHADICVGGRFLGNNHRINLVVTDQDDVGFGEPVTLYDLGSGSGNIIGCEVVDFIENLTASFTADTANASPIITVTDGGLLFAEGQTVSGPGIPAGTTVTAVDENEVTLSANATQTASDASLTLSVPVTRGTAALTNPRYLNLFRHEGRNLAADRSAFVCRLISAQDWTTTPTAVLGTGIDATGWHEYYNSSTGEFTLPFAGLLQIDFKSAVTGVTSDERFYMRVYVNGTPTEDLQEDVAALPSPGRKILTFGAAYEVAEGDVVKVEIATLNSTRTIFGSTSVTLTAK